MIILNQEDALYMLMMLELTPKLKQVLNEISSEGGEISDDYADELRDLCNDKLDVCGYDNNYKLNEDGNKLEMLADKLFIG